MMPSYMYGEPNSQSSGAGNDLRQLRAQRGAQTGRHARRNQGRRRPPGRHGHRGIRRGCGEKRETRRTVAGTPGVTKAAVDLQAATATVEYDADVVKPETLAGAVRALGYEVPA